MPTDAAAVPLHFHHSLLGRALAVVVLLMMMMVMNTLPLSLDTQHTHNTHTPHSLSLPRVTVCNIKLTYGAVGDAIILFEDATAAAVAEEHSFSLFIQQRETTVVCHPDDNCCVSVLLVCLRMSRNSISQNEIKASLFGK